MAYTMGWGDLGCNSCMWQVHGKMIEQALYLIEHYSMYRQMAWQIWYQGYDIMNIIRANQQADGL